MSIEVIHCRVDAIYGILKSLKIDSPDFRLYSRAVLHRSYDGCVSRLLNDFMRLVTESKSESIILFDPFSWMTYEGSGSGLAHEEFPDSDDSDDDGDYNAANSDGGKGRSNDLVFAVISWFRAHSQDKTNRLLLFSTTKLPKRFADLGLRAIDHPVQHDHLQNDRGTSLNVHHKSIQPESRCIGLRGLAGSGRTTALLRLAEEHEVIWMMVHEIVNCELGESGHIVRSLFAKASGNRPGLLVMDDADLILSSSGRIMKEIIEEIGSCMDEYGTSVKFIFSFENSVDDFLFSKIDTLIDF